MKFSRIGNAHRYFCDLCGFEIKPDDISVSYTFEDGGGKDRCYGSTGITDLQVENDMYEKYRESHDDFYSAEDALSGDSYVFCHPCCCSSEDSPYKFHHDVRAVRSKILTKILEGSYKEPNPYDDLVECLEDNGFNSWEFRAAVNETKDEELIAAIEELLIQEKRLRALLNKKLEENGTSEQK
jgi:hypothetical protein